MRAALLALALVTGPAFASDPVPTLKIAAKKTSPARRVYDLVLTTGFPAHGTVAHYQWGQRKVRELQAPNDITFEAYATDDAGPPVCAVWITGGLGKVKEAAEMGLPIPTELIDRGCRGQRKSITLYKSSGDDEQIDMTQKQLDILFSMIEDCLKNGV